MYTEDEEEKDASSFDENMIEEGTGD